MNVKKEDVIPFILGIEFSIPPFETMDSVNEFVTSIKKDIEYTKISSSNDCVVFKGPIPLISTYLSLDSINITAVPCEGSILCIEELLQKIQDNNGEGVFIAKEIEEFAIIQEKHNRLLVHDLEKYCDIEDLGELKESTLTFDFEKNSTFYQLTTIYRKNQKGGAIFLTDKTPHKFISIKDFTKKGINAWSSLHKLLKVYLDKCTLPSGEFGSEKNE